MSQGAGKRERRTFPGNGERMDLADLYAAGLLRRAAPSQLDPFRRSPSKRVELIHSAQIDDLFHLANQPANPLAQILG